LPCSDRKSSVHDVIDSTPTRALHACPLATSSVIKFASTVANYSLICYRLKSEALNSLVPVGSCMDFMQLLYLSLPLLNLVFSLAKFYVIFFVLISVLLVVE